MKEKENFYIQSEQHNCFFSDLPIYVVEVPTKDHGRPDVIEAKEKELQNLVNFDTFEEVTDSGQDTIDSRWVINQKEDHDGQKTKIKARIVAKGYQEAEKPQSDSPTVSRESLKVFIAVAANEQFKICAVDITGAFLQADRIDRELFLRPPVDIRKKKPGILWRLNKPLYGLDDSSRKFYLRVKKLFLKNGLEILPADNAYFYCRKNGNLVGQVVIHVDDFFISGNNEFIDTFLVIVAENLKVSKIEYGSFRFTGVDIRQEEKKIIVSMNAYADSLQPIQDFRKVQNEELLNDLELNVYRKFTGKLLWLAENCRPDLAYVSNMLSKRSHVATISDLKFINKVLKKVKERTNEVVYSEVGRKEDLVIRSMSDASYLKARESTGGSLVLLASTKNSRVVPLYWKSKRISKVCTSTKDAETHALFKNVGDASFAATTLETLLFGSSNKAVKVECFIDSKPLLESLASTKIVENKFLVAEVNALKTLMEEEVVREFVWVDTDNQLADALTKDMNEPRNFRSLFLWNKYDFRKFEENPKAVLKVHDVGTDDESREIKLQNGDKR